MLRECPLCGGGETREEGKYLPPRMSGPGALISYVIRHWCSPIPGVVQQYREVRGREKADAIAAYNRRPISASEPPSTSPQTPPVQQG